MESCHFSMWVCWLTIMKNIEKPITGNMLIPVMITEVIPLIDVCQYLWWKKSNSHAFECDVTYFAFFFSARTHCRSISLVFHSGSGPCWHWQCSCHSSSWWSSSPRRPASSGLARWNFSWLTKFRHSVPFNPENQLPKWWVFFVPFTVCSFFIPVVITGLLLPVTRLRLDCFTVALDFVVLAWDLRVLVFQILLARLPCRI